MPTYNFTWAARRGSCGAISWPPGYGHCRGDPRFEPPVYPRASRGSCVKLYVSVKQQIKSANGEVISPMDLRLVRRIVRDIQFRDTSPERTLAMWPQVVRGRPLHPPLPPYRRLHGQLHPYL